MKTLILNCGAQLNADVEDWGGVKLQVEVAQRGAMKGKTFADTALDVLELTSVTILIDPEDLEDIALFFDDLIDEREKEG